ncbi:Boi1p [Saccharomyces cerevisiae x Saccharomyces kudriavzevii VIN7]|uniref:Boi1p n=1 Tax=Saccharomyces cerevisiae x Saccharomyces kudriavzevii (strain VIN7) TaxID=1095631 RepID=H0GUW9_SACCK|nr:Boi1p [Saccharomyces cerevisiae x Saccharomyces kudriavzevii VIN7]
MLHLIIRTEIPLFTITIRGRNPEAHLLICSTGFQCYRQSSQVSTKKKMKQPSKASRAVFDSARRKSSYGHSRDASLSEMKKHRRNSSILSFFSSKSQSNPTSPTKQTFTIDPAKMTSHSRSQSNSYSHARSQSYSHSRKHSLVTSPLKISLSVKQKIS